jgi:hypothetical protein
MYVHGDSLRATTLCCTPLSFSFVCLQLLMYMKASLSLEGLADQMWA